MLALAAAEDLDPTHLDVKTAFLNGKLEETIHMKQPPGYEKGGTSMVCLLRKALYGLKQAPRAWHARLHMALESLGFKASVCDPRLYVLHGDDGRQIIVYLLVYVDNLLWAERKGAASKTRASLMDTFDMRDLREASLFLGFEITRDRVAGTIMIDQKRMVKDGPGVPVRARQRTLQVQLP